MISAKDKLRVITWLNRLNKEINSLDDNSINQLKLVHSSIVENLVIDTLASIRTILARHTSMGSVVVSKLDIHIENTMVRIELGDSDGFMEVSSYISGNMIFNTTVSMYKIPTIRLTAVWCVIVGFSRLLPKEKYGVLLNSLFYDEVYSNEWGISEDDLFTLHQATFLHYHDYHTKPAKKHKL